jgi:transposase
MARPRKYPPEMLDRGARVVIKSGRPIAHVARDLGVPAETLRRRVRRVEADEGLRPNLPTAAEREEIRALRKEVYELRRANEILKAASVFFATELDADRCSLSVPVLSVKPSGEWVGDPHAGRGVGAVGGLGRVRADAQPYLGPRSGVAPDRRHDG